MLTLPRSTCSSPSGEYEMHSANWPDSLRSLHQKDMPCAVCQYSVNDPNGFMLPGKTHCPAVNGRNAFVGQEREEAL